MTASERARAREQEVRRRVEAGESQVEIAADLGVSRQRIGQLIERIGIDYRGLADARRERRRARDLGLATELGAEWRATPGATIAGLARRRNLTVSRATTLLDMAGVSRRPRPWTLDEMLARTRTTPEGCMVWTGPACGDYGATPGGGALSLDVERFAHRYVYVLARGPIPPGKWIGHRTTCTSRLCIHPDHLVARTPAETVAVAQAAGRRPKRRNREDDR